MRVSFNLWFLELQIWRPLDLMLVAKLFPCSNKVKLLGITTDNELKFKSVPRIFVRNHRINYMP